MCNKNNNPAHHEEDYRFLDYRLNQLEHKIEQGMEKIEKETKENNAELMSMLRTMQNGMNEQSRTLIQVSEKQVMYEEKLATLNGTPVALKEHEERLITLEETLKSYRNILFTVAGGLAVAILVDVVKFL